MKRIAILMFVAAATAAALPAGVLGARATSLPFKFYLTHYEMLGDPNNPSGVYYHSNGRPFADAPDGRRVILAGKGSWDPATARVAGGGTYEIRDAAGDLAAAGRWHAAGFRQFKMLSGWWGIDGFDERGWQGPPGSASFSGILTMDVHLVGQGRGVLRIWCLMPETPKPGDHIGDGMTLTGGPFNFGDYHGTEQSYEGVMFYSR